MKFQRRTARLLLRQPTATDAETLFGIYGDPRTSAFNPAERYGDIDVARIKLEAWIAHWEQHGFGRWAVARTGDPSVIIGFGGVSSLAYGPDIRLNLGYRFSVEAWGNGYATELAREALHYALCELRQPEVFAVVRPANKASIRVLEKVGMATVGSMDDALGQPRILFRADQATWLQPPTTRSTSSP